MEPSFERHLLSSGVGKSAVQALAAEGIVSKHIFKSLKEEHIVHLLKCDGMTIGSHALLWELWDTEISAKPCGMQSTSSSPYSTSPQMSSPEDRKELFRRYQAKMKDAKGKKLNENKSTKLSKNLLIQFGGMVYDPCQQKGVRRKTIPSPVSMSFSGSISYNEILRIGQQTFFPDFKDDPIDSFCLAGSNGNVHKVGNPDTWTLSTFLKEIGVSPSKLRLYVVFRPEEDDLAVSETQKKEKEESEDDTAEVEGVTEVVQMKRRSPPALIQSESESDTAIQTGPIIQNCITCSKPYRTYVPNSNCVMPDGTSITYRDPQNECPDCDDVSAGWYWNTDLFPQFASWKTH